MAKCCSIQEALQLLARGETGKADYYRACAEQWEQDSGIWVSLARQEAGHVAMFERMAALAAAAPERYSLRSLFNPQRSETFIAWMASCAAEVKCGGIDRRTAFKAAAEIEKTILHGNMQDLVLTDDCKFQDIMEQIVAESKTHAALVGTCMAEI